MNPGGLIDIINPLPPPLAVVSTHWGLWVALLLVVLVILSGGVWWRCRMGRRTRRNIRRLCAQYERGVLDGRSVAYQLAEHLRAYLQLAQLPADCPPGVPLAARAGWSELVAQLNQLRYQPGYALNVAQWQLLLKQVDLCLRGCR